MRPAAPEYIRIVDITKTVTEPLNAINDTPKGLPIVGDDVERPGSDGLANADFRIARWVRQSPTDESQIS